MGGKRDRIRVVVLINTKGEGKIKKKKGGFCKLKFGKCACTCKEEAVECSIYQSQKKGK